MIPRSITGHHERRKQAWQDRVRRRAGRLADRARVPVPTDVAERIVWGEPDECWPWVGGRHREDYGRWHGVIVHRMVWERATGQVLGEDDYIDHLCFVTFCQNPDHMEVVTKSENSYRRNEPKPEKEENERRAWARVEEWYMEKYGVGA